MKRRTPCVTVMYAIRISRVSSFTSSAGTSVHVLAT
jgi:hypothetical protein